MHPNIEKVLIDEKTLKTRIAEMAAEISKDYGKNSSSLAC